MAGSRLEAVAREEAVWLSGATMGVPCRSAILLPKARRTASSFGALLSLLFLERSSPASRGLDIRRYRLLPHKAGAFGCPARDSGPPNNSMGATRPAAKKSIRG